MFACRYWAGRAQKTFIGALLLFFSFPLLLLLLYHLHPTHLSTMLLCRRTLTKSNWVSSARSLGLRHYGVPPAVAASDPRLDKTVQVTSSKGVNIIHDPLLSKGKRETKERKQSKGKGGNEGAQAIVFPRYCIQPR